MISLEENRQILELIADEIAEAALKIGAFRPRLENPVLWASGFYMPVYNDNRMFLYYPDLRDKITDGFMRFLPQDFDLNLIDERKIVIAGTSTAGIAPGAMFAFRACMPFIYVRDKPKDHGLKNQIEGIDANKDLEGRATVLIEDLISTGGSSAKAVQAIRNANGVCNHCYSIFKYGFEEAEKCFSSMTPPCNSRSIYTYDRSQNIAKRKNYWSLEEIRGLEEWRADPFNWGEKHGFPRVVKN